MGWGRMFFLGNIGQQLDIEDQQREIEALKSEIQSRAANHGSQDLNRRLDRIEAENGSLRLTVAALVRYLGNKGMLDRNEFGQIIDTIDAEDGAADGQYTGQIND